MKTVTKDGATGTRPEYYIVRDGGFEYLVRRDAAGQHLLLRSENREQVYTGILTDRGVCVYEATAGELLEGIFGEPKLRFGEYSPRERPVSIFRGPEKIERAVKNERGSASQSAEQSSDDYCRVHLRDKYKDGKTRGGKQKYRCPMCDRKEPAVTDPSQANRGVRRRVGGTRTRGKNRVAKRGSSPWQSAQAASVASKIKKNPQCASCGERLRVGGRHRLKDGTRTTYWKCINKCPQRVEPDWKSWGDEQLREHFIEVVRRVNGHSPQDTPDIAHSMVAALLDHTRDFGELHDPKVVRKFVNSIRRLSQDKHGLLPLDAPVKPDEDGGQTYADRLVSPTLNPEEALLAKEVDQG